MNCSDTALAEALTACQNKMSAAGCTANCIQAFLNSVRRVHQAGAGLIPESTVQPLSALPRLEDLSARNDEQLLNKLVVIKLNGGLGTKMGLDCAKSLVRVKDSYTFLDFIARQILWLRERFRGPGPAFLLMNSFRTQQDSLAYLARYPELPTPSIPLDFLQSKVPKIDPQTLLPVSYPSDPDLEWCPPGHGDLYPALADSGLIEIFLKQGIEYAFVSNSDNLAATVDLSLLSYFAKSGLAFLMEVAERTETDLKGGHLAQRIGDGRLILREIAQCPEEDRPHFESARHRFFNTNNLWIKLSAVRQSLPSLTLPIITNLKPVNPQDPGSSRVIQLETAMGAAIECFEPSGAVAVPRSRFSPVKDTADLLALRSDAYMVADDFRLSLEPSRAGRPPMIRLDPACYAQLTDFEEHFAAGAPSLRQCDALHIDGPWQFADGVVLRGRVQFVNRTPEPKIVPAGTYLNQSLTGSPPK